MYIYMYVYIHHPRLANDSQFLEIKKSFEGPVLNCRGSTRQLAIIEMKLSFMKFGTKHLAIFHNFLFSCCKIEFVQLW